MNHPPLQFHTFLAVDCVPQEGPSCAFLALANAIQLEKNRRCITRQEVKALEEVAIPVELQSNRMGYCAGTNEIMKYFWKGGNVANLQKGVFPYDSFLKLITEQIPRFSCVLIHNGHAVALLFELVKLAVGFIIRVTLADSGSVMTLNPQTKEGMTSLYDRLTEHYRKLQSSIIAPPVYQPLPLTPPPPITLAPVISSYLLRPSIVPPSPPPETRRLSTIPSLNLPSSMTEEETSHHLVPSTFRLRPLTYRPSTPLSTDNVSNNNLNDNSDHHHRH